MVGTVLASYRGGLAGWLACLLILRAIMRPSDLLDELYMEALALSLSSFLLRSSKVVLPPNNVAQGGVVFYPILTGELALRRALPGTSSPKLRRCPLSPITSHSRRQRAARELFLLISPVGFPLSC